jgi:hypothetical protein
MTRPTRGEELFPAILALACVLFYLFYSLATLDLPGLCGEEAMKCLLLLKLLSGKPIPLVYNSTSGVLRIIAHLPLFVLFGRTPAALRLTCVGCTLLLFGALFSFFSRAFSRRSACWLVALTSTDLVFVQYSKLGYFSEFIFLMLCLWWGLCALQKFSLNSRARWLCLAFFLFGLGLHIKITFLWYLLGAAASFLLVDRLASLKRLSAKQAAMAGAAFAAGFGLTLIHYFRTSGAAIRLLWANLRGQTTWTGVDNTRYGEHLALRLHQTVDTLAGKMSDLGLGWRGVRIPLIVQFAGWISLAAAAVAAAALLWSALHPAEKAKGAPGNPEGFLFVLFAVVFLGLPLTISDINPAHVFILYPCAQIAIALLFERLCRRAESGPARWALQGFFAAAILLNVAGNVSYARELRRAGVGVSTWSPVVEDVVRYLDARGIREVFTASWDTQKTLEYLGRGRIVPLRYAPEKDRDLCFDVRYPESDIEGFVFQAKGSPPPIFYLSNAESGARDGVLLARGARAHAGRLTVENVFLNPSGVPLFTLYRLD